MNATNELLAEDLARAAARKRVRDAAPKLLEALKDLVDDAEEGGFERTVTQASINKAKAAIAEAEGKP